MIIPKHILMAAALTLAGCAAALSLTSPDSNDEYDQWVDPAIEAARADSIHAAEVGALLDETTSLFHSVMTRSTEPQTADYFNDVERCYKLNLDLVGQLRDTDSEAKAQARQMLQMLDDNLEAGAFFFSGENNPQRMADFAQYFIDLQLLPIMKGVRFMNDPETFPKLAYIAASQAYNQQQYERSIPYFQAFLSTPETDRREQIYTFLGQACLNSGNYELAVESLNKGVELYPNNEHMVMLAIKAAIDGRHGEMLQPLLDKALKLRPEDLQLLNIQAQLHEDTHNYAGALDIYNYIDQVDPHKLSTAKRIALCYYNLGTEYYNASINSTDEQVARKARRQSKIYFSSAAQKLDEVLATEPTAVRYLKALGICQLQTGQKEQFDQTNRRLAAFGENVLDEVLAPPVLTYNSDGSSNFDGVLSGGDISGTVVASNDAPPFSKFAADYIAKGLAEWSKKGEFEKMDDYNARVNESTLRNHYQELSNEVATRYLDKYAKRLRISDLKLLPYDTDNETFKVETSYGPVYFQVPLKNGEAEQFKSNWEGVQFRNPKYYIENDQVRISAITVRTPSGKSYTYDNTKNVPSYEQALANINYNEVIQGLLADKYNSTNPAANPAANQGGASVINITRTSDVDNNIPRTNRQATNNFALVIANENYQNVGDVASALHDGRRFAEYCRLTLGIPESHVMLCENATYGNLVGALDQLKNTVNSFGGKADVIVYYAGHGMPTEKMDAYLMPVDGNPTIPSTNLSLERFYDELGNMDAANVMVFLDACFSGVQRDGQELVKSARAVSYKPKEVAPKGSMFVFSATTGQQTAFPYQEKNHGLFTYYILKKLQMSKGDVNLKDLSQYVIDQVSRQSNVINHKPQTPSVRTSGNMVNIWTSKKLRP